MSQSSNLPSLLEGLDFKVESTTKDIDFGLITTMELVIMNANKEKIGNVRLFLVPREVGRHGDYFDIMDAVNDDLSNYALACANEKGFLHEHICTHNGTRRWERVDSKQIVYLDEIFVDEALRGHGVGTWAINSLLKSCANVMNMMVTSTALPPHCVNELKLPGSALTAAQRAFFENRAGDFFSKVGFRRLGNTQFLGLHKNPDHPSRNLAASDDLPYQGGSHPVSDEALLRYIMGNPFANR
ncbi:hypothetical protein CPB83DRAFT_884948 [Crepidotus variabilis]|uniref:N-acetyltransferase domain-containing protein n=1 Tax=Crepidotus variabilis TaxID=179855 RepID=A0A9P6EC69_9AGAR|nr:hypothetical protein CPB83DRAFT_884948 [Crepidotus variabilis]